MAATSAPSLWLSDGWAWVQAERCRRAAVLAGEAVHASLGWQDIDPAAPVTHISFYEADAFASWAGARLPTEIEWEAAAFDPASGQQLDAAGPVQPAMPGDDAALQQMFGSVWEWTGSAYRPYPGFRAAPGAVGEYNGKFMSGQFVLRGGSCATPRRNLRASYAQFLLPVTSAGSSPACGLPRIFDMGLSATSRSTPTITVDVAFRADVHAGLGQQPKRRFPRAGSMTRQDRRCSRISPRCPNIIRRAAKPIC
jgi:formylglycine-generating enzyme required for sulfatase activity